MLEFRYDTRLLIEVKNPAKDSISDLTADLKGDYLPAVKGLTGLTHPPSLYIPGN